MANDPDTRHGKLFVDQKRAFDAAETGPFQAPAVAVKVSGGIVQGTVSNMPCDVLVIDYDCDGEEGVVPVPERNGDTDSARMYEEAPLIEAKYLATLFALKDIVDVPDELRAGEPGIYLIEDGAGSMVRYPLTIDSDGRIATGDGLPIGDTDSLTASARLILRGRDPVEVGGDWHMEMEQDGLLDDALTLCAQGHSPEAAAEAARERHPAMRP